MDSNNKEPINPSLLIILFISPATSFLLFLFAFYTTFQLWAGNPGDTDPVWFWTNKALSALYVIVHAASIARVIQLSKRPGVSKKLRFGVAGLVVLGLASLFLPIYLLWLW